MYAATLPHIVVGDSAGVPHDGVVDLKRLGPGQKLTRRVVIERRIVYARPGCAGDIDARAIDGMGAVVMFNQRVDHSENASGQFNGAARIVRAVSNEP